MGIADVCTGKILAVEDFQRLVVVCGNIEIGIDALFRRKLIVDVGLYFEERISQNFHSARSRQGDLLGEVMAIEFSANEIAVYQWNTIRCVKKGSPGDFGSNVPFVGDFYGFQTPHV